MSATQQRSVIVAIVVSSALSIVLFVAWASLTSAGIISPTYGLQISVIAQGPSKVRSILASEPPFKAIRSQLIHSGVKWSVTRSQFPAISVQGTATHNWITVAHFAMKSSDLAALEKVLQLVQRDSEWPVRNIDRGGEFTEVLVRPGVTVLRLSELVEVPGSVVRPRLQTSGPSVIFSPADLLPASLIVLLVLSFGATERNDSDVFAFPRGMQPAIVSCQLLTLGIFCCFMLTYVRTAPSHFNAGLLVLDAFVGVSIARWLWISAPSWRSAMPLRVARRIVAITGACVCVAGLWISGGII